MRPAVVLADYDSIAYFLMRPSQDGGFLRKSMRGVGWPQTLHLHRTRYLSNTQEAADELSHIVYSLQTDITNLILYRQTVMGIRITKPTARGAPSTLSDTSNPEPTAPRSRPPTPSTLSGCRRATCSTSFSITATASCSRLIASARPRGGPW